jgi:hypothetical protein
VKLLPIVDLELGPKFLQEIKIHYSNDIKMIQHWLNNVAIPKVGAKE